MKGWSIGYIGKIAPCSRDRSEAPSTTVRRTCRSRIDATDVRDLPEKLEAMPVRSEHEPTTTLKTVKMLRNRQHAMRVHVCPCLHAEQRILDLWSLALQCAVWDVG